jgi:opacity protein-like surface antigen
MRTTTLPTPALALCLITLLLACSIPATAAIDWTARVGLAVSNLHQRDLTSGARHGLAVGAGGRYDLGTDGWAVGTEFWYQRKGFRRGTYENRIGLQMRADVLTVPLLLSYRFPGERFSGRAFAGVAADVVLRTEFQESAQVDWQDVTDQDEEMAWLLVLGGGVQVTGGWDLDVRYQHGLTPLTSFDWTQFDDRLSTAHEFADATDTTWSITLGRWF